MARRHLAPPCPRTWAPGALVDSAPASNRTWGTATKRDDSKVAWFPLLSHFKCGLLSVEIFRRDDKIGHFQSAPVDIVYTLTV